MFGWLGGFGVDGENTDDFHKAWILSGRLTYRYPISKTADGTQQILYSSDLSSWTSRGISQRLLSEDGNRVVVEATAPIGARGFLRLEAERPPFPVETVRVGNAGNSSDTSGYGSVSYEYEIGKYEVTIAQYTEFLNAVAKSDPYGLYNTNMASDLNVAGILRSGLSGSYFYSIANNNGPSGARPISYVSWFDAARFCNWLHNGATNGANTESGAYTLNGANVGVMRNANAQWWIPNENEWYKAAYHKGNGPTSGYWLYPTRSNVQPNNNIGTAPNQANYYAGKYAVSQSPEYSPTNNYLTAVGAFRGSPSSYNTFDQGGGLYEWNDGGAGISRGIRGGHWSGGGLESTADRYVDGGLPTLESAFIGFRVARNAED